jgi:CRP-like cAMP-binding protein
MTFQEGSSFGEKAIKNNQPRMGTCIAMTNCFCSLVDKGLYLKILKKLQDEQNIRMIAFLKQYEFLQQWNSRELLNFSFLLENKTIAMPNSNLFEEGHSAEHFAIIKTGEFDLIKTKLNHVFLNTSSGII